MKKAMSIRSVILLLTLLLFSVPSYSQRVRESFDWNWQFHKGDIAIKLAVKAGMQGGLSDVNVKRVEGEEVIIAYTDRNKVAEYKPADWQDVNLPHDWLVEEPIVHDNNIGSQPAGNGFRPTGIGFYRKEFEIPESDKGKRFLLNSMAFSEQYCLGQWTLNGESSEWLCTFQLRFVRCSTLWK